tara:strand:+ start:450 stop:785 length:336 start_codon:yes stop_codon:yes gene_type:complete
MKIGKYEFVKTNKKTAEQVAKEKINGLGLNEDGQPNHGHAIVEIGYIVLEDGVTDENFNVIKEPVFSDKYHVDVMWDGLEDHPYGWKSYAVTPSDQGVHQFLGVDYLENKI